MQGHVFQQLERQVTCTMEQAECFDLLVSITPLPPCMFYALVQLNHTWRGWRLSSDVYMHTIHMAWAMLQGPTLHHDMVA